MRPAFYWHHCVRAKFKGKTRHLQGHNECFEYLEHVSIFERTPTGSLHPHVGLLSLLILWTVVQILGLDEVQALVNLRRLKLDKMQVPCRPNMLASTLQTQSGKASNEVNESRYASKGSDNALSTQTTTYMGS